MKKWENILDTTRKNIRNGNDSNNSVVVLLKPARMYYRSTNKINFQK